jgi:hypothetical protein
LFRAKPDQEEEQPDGHERGQHGILQRIGEGK